MVARILLVEDNDSNRDMLSRRLERKGYEILLAADGQQGIDMALEAPPDPAIMPVRTLDTSASSRPESVIACCMEI